MNFLPLRGGSLVSRVPLLRPRTSTIQYLLLGNTALYGYYLLSSGPKRLQFRKVFVAEEDSSQLSFLFCHFGHTSLPMFLFNSACLYTIGNYHVVKYGCNHFIKLYALGCIAGGLLTAANV